MKKLITLLLFTAAAAFSPVPPELVEQWYSAGFYPDLQTTVTPVTNLVPVAVADVAVALLVLATIVAFRRAVRTRGLGRAFGRVAVWALAWSAVLYLLFLGMWGLNYRRVPLEEKLVFDRAAIAPEAVVRLLSTSIDRLNAGHASAHARTLDTRSLSQAFFVAQDALRAPRWIAPGLPKRSLLQWYFRKAALNGITIPYFHEVIINDELLPVEVPATLAHEWAHLAGYADESEANFVAWLACIRSPDPLIQYSGWLESYVLAFNAVPRGMQVKLPRLAEGPRQDIRDMVARFNRSSPRVRTAANRAYDQYLKANRVEEGIRSYGAALQLMLGTTFEPDWMPVMR